eukprot:COSAG02_NODE_10799_length_1855_cov_147.789662_2_plen_156_part_00
MGGKRRLSDKEENRKRMMERMSKEDKDGNKKVVVPPANKCVQPLVDHIEIQPDTQQQSQEREERESVLLPSRGRRRETPGDLRPSTCAPTTHPGYFDGAGHNGTIAWRLILRAARANAVRKLPADDGEQSENGRVPLARRSRATHRQGHAASRSR